MCVERPVHLGHLETSSPDRDRVKTGNTEFISFRFLLMLIVKVVGFICKNTNAPFPRHTAITSMLVVIGVSVISVSQSDDLKAGLLFSEQEQLD